ACSNKELPFRRQELWIDYTRLHVIMSFSQNMKQVMAKEMTLVFTIVDPHVVLYSRAKQQGTGMFKAYKKSKYAYAVLLYLVKIVAILSKKEAHSLKWNRSFNKHGTKAENIPLDLRMEQLKQDSENYEEITRGKSQ
ncbi:Pogo transposable element with KRAB domain, partial [Paramuricea clavata]